MKKLNHTIPTGATLIVAHKGADLAAVRLEDGEEALVLQGRVYLCKNAGLVVMDLCVEEMTRQEYVERLTAALPPKGGRIRSRKNLVEAVLGRPHRLWW